LTAARPPPIERRLVFAMAIATGIAAANMYYNQPMLGMIERDFPHTVATRLIPPATQLGFALGMFLLVPLGDLMQRRVLITLQFLLLSVALAAAALAPTGWALVAASLAVGVCSSAAQQIVPFAAALATPATRGRTLGTVMGGLLCGLLFSRTLAGFVAGHYGWRAMFWLAVPLVLAAAALMATLLPRQPTPAALRYADALRSLAHIWRSEPRLRNATLQQAALFAAFSAFWSVLALHLQDPPFGLGPGAAGLFGIVGAVGVFAAPVAGRLADRRGPRLVIVLGAVSVLASWVIAGVWTHMAGLIIGVIVLDFGVQSAMVSNQHVIYALRPDARSRLNTLYMTGIFCGGALGSSGATAAFFAGGWTYVCLFGAALAAISLTLMGLAAASSKTAVAQTES
jgi:predicted MFS family arabinose efflux permease